MSSENWYQQALTPPSVTELRIRLGIIPDADHAQVQVELVDPTTNVQIGMWTCPHRSWTRWADLLDWARLVAVRELDGHFDPF